jgi:hypothetical protein
VKSRIGASFLVLQEIRKRFVKNTDFLRFVVRYEDDRVEVAEGGPYDGCGDAKDP